MFRLYLSFACPFFPQKWQVTLLDRVVRLGLDMSLAMLFVESNWFQLLSSFWPTWSTYTSTWTRSINKNIWLIKIPPHLSPPRLRFQCGLFCIRIFLTSFLDPSSIISCSSPPFFYSIWCTSSSLVKINSSRSCLSLP